MKLIVFYDGQCPLCQKEISHYQTLEGSQQIEWVDITVSPERLKPYDVTFTEAMQVIHGVNEDNQRVKGIEVFMLIWTQLDRYRWLARLISGCHLQKGLNQLYYRFANWRFSRRGLQSCRLDNQLSSAQSVSLSSKPCNRTQSD